LQKPELKKCFLGLWLKKACTTCSKNIFKMDFKTIPRYKPVISKNTKQIILSRLLKGNLESGDSILKFEKSFSDYIQVKNSFSVSSNSLGLYIALKSLHLKKGDEIIMPSYNFWGIANMALLSGLKPIFCDINKDTFNINPSLIEKHITKKTKALLITHMFGQPCDIKKIKEITGKHHIHLIEDCALSCGAEYNNKKTGSFGDISVFSFNPYKNLTTFGGGMVSTNSKEISEKLSGIREKLSNTNKKKLIKDIVKTYIMKNITNPYIYTFLIYPLLHSFPNKDIVDKLNRTKIKYMDQLPKNYQSKYTNLQASVGIEHLKILDEMNKKRINNAKLLNKLLHNIKGIKTPHKLPNVKHIYDHYVIKCKNKQEIFKKLLKNRIDAKRQIQEVCSELDIYSPYKTNCPVAKSINKEIIGLPVGPYLKEKEVFKIYNALK